MTSEVEGQGLSQPALESMGNKAELQNSKTKAAM